MNKLILSIFVAAIAVFAVIIFDNPSSASNGSTLNPPQEKVVLPFPENVAKVLETSCFDCHGNTSSNEKALAKINFAVWDTLSDAKKVGKMQDIKDMVTQGKMPPEKYLAKFPDHALGQEQKDLILQWVEAESDKLMGD